MKSSLTIDLVRRSFVKAGCAFGATTVFARYGVAAAAEPEPETHRIRFVHAPSICTAPMYLAEELLRMEGFTEVEYLPLGSRNGPLALAEGRGDITMWDTPGLIPHLDAGRPIVLLTGVHGGC